MTDVRDRRGLLALLLAAVCIGSLLVLGHPDASDQRPAAYTAPNVSPFTDVRGPSTGSPHTFYREIAWLAERQISTGYASPAGRRFDPGAPVLREQMAAFLYRLAGEPAVQLPAISPFTDLPSSHPFYKHIVWLQSTGVTTGYAEGPGRSSFRGSQPVLREQMAAFLFRFRAWENAGTAPTVPTTDARPFTDIAATHAFQREIRWLASSGISTGYDGPGGPAFRPASPVLREQMAAFLFRYDELDEVVTPPPTSPPPTSPTPSATTSTPTPPVPEAPSVAGLSSTSGSVAGGYAITVHGTGFTGATDVTFGDVAAPLYYVSSPTTVNVSVPPAAEVGPVDVHVTTPAGRSPRGVTFTYTAAPTETTVVSSVSPASGDEFGGRTVTLQGSGFEDVRAVSFGSIPAASFEVRSPTWITVVTPQSPVLGPVPIVVTTGKGSFTGPDFTFVESVRPRVTSISPAVGEVSGGHAVRITGSYFGLATAVKFGEVNAASFRIENGTNIVATAPQVVSPGSVKVTVLNGAGGSVQPVTFEYFADGVLPRLQPGGLPRATALVPYDERLTVHDERPGRWEIVSGALPPGLRLDGDRITGFPVRPGQYPVTLRFTGETGPARSSELLVHVAMPAWITGVSDGTTTAVVTTGDPPGTHGPPTSAAATPDGRYVVYVATSTDVNSNSPRSQVRQVFRRDLVTGTTIKITVAADGTPANSSSLHPSVSDDGRYVAFASHATNLVPADSNGKIDVFVRDVDLGVTTRVSVTSAGDQVPIPTGEHRVGLSGDGRYVVFVSELLGLTPDVTGNGDNVYRHDRKTGVTELVSTRAGTPAGQVRAGRFGAFDVSADGRYVAFRYEPTTTFAAFIVVRDMVTGIEDRVSVSESGLFDTKGDGAFALSADGQRVAFVSVARNLVPGVTSGEPYIYLRDRAANTTTLVSTSVEGRAVPVPASDLDISADGEHIVFVSAAQGLVHAPQDGRPDTFVHDTVTGLTEIVSTDVGGQPLRSATLLATDGAVSRDGSEVFFLSKLSSAATAVDEVLRHSR